MKVQTPEERKAAIDAAIEDMREQPLSHWKWTRERRACEHCKHVRTVKVNYTWDRESRTWTRPSWSKSCTACEHIRNAVKYERLAEYNREKARVILEKRARKAGAAFK